MITSPSATVRGRVLRQQEVCETIGVCRGTLWRWQRDGHFPKPRQIGPDGPKSLTGWLASDIEAWLAGRPILQDSTEL